MTVQVLLYPPHYPLSHSISREFVENAFGDGYAQTISQESSYLRADGVGGVTSHYGVNRFTLQFNRAIHGAGQLEEYLWNFFRDRLDSGNEPFYFYNPTECNFVIDPTGVSSVGRYLVRLEDPNQILTKEYYRYNLFRFGGIKLVEDRNLSGIIGVIGINISDEMIYEDTILTPQIYVYVEESYDWENRDSVIKSMVYKDVKTGQISDALNIVDSVSIQLVEL